MECNFIDTALICDFFKQPQNELYFFFFLSEVVELDYFNVIKQNIGEIKICKFDYFFEYANFNFEGFFSENFYSKQDFYLLERIVSQIFNFILV